MSMSHIEQGKKLFLSHLYAIRTDPDVTIVLCEGSEFERRRDKAIDNYAKGTDPNSVIALIDDSVFKAGSSGALFCDYKFYYTGFLQKPQKIWYDEIERIYVNKEIIKGQEREVSIEIQLKNGKSHSWFIESIGKQAVVDFVLEMVDLVENPEIGYYDVNIDATKKNTDYGATSGGAAASKYKTVNKVFEEEKFHASQGHGFSAERANHFSDQMRGKDAKIVGDDNAKNGADRIVDGVFIQSKYCATGNGCINACFDKDGVFRYIGKNGEPMVIEVPNDQKIYADAVAAMRRRIQNGQIPGVTNPDDATKYVKRGTVSYKQAVNIAKAGTVDSLIYDSQHGIVTSASAFGVSAVVSFASSIWNGEGFDVAIKKATLNGLKVGGTAFITTLLASQLAKAGLNSSLVASSETVIQLMGPKAAAVLINAFRSSSNVYGAAAMKSAAKLLRGNVITGIATFAILSIGDVVKIFQGRISGAQLFKGLANTSVALAGGTGGFLGGAAIGSAIAPGIGTVVGAFVGSIGLGASAGKASDAIISKFIEDDAEKMVAIIEVVFQDLAGEYMLNKVEAEKIVDALSKELNGKKLQDMFASGNHRGFARELLVPFIESQVSKRRHIKLPPAEQMNAVLRELLEDVADETGLQPAAI